MSAHFEQVDACVTQRCDVAMDRALLSPFSHVFKTRDTDCAGVQPRAGTATHLDRHLCADKEHRGPEESQDQRQLGHNLRQRGNEGAERGVPC